MSILVNRETRLLVQGITGREGTFHTEQMVAYGTNVVAGVTPGKGGQHAAGVPVFDTVRQAVDATQPNVSAIFVPPPFGYDAIMEALGAGVTGVVCITEGIPTQDMVKAYRFLQELDGWMIGPNCPGIITPGECKVGILPGHIFTPGNVGVVSRSGTLTYEIVNELTNAGLGQSTCVGIGGDPIIGSSFVDILKRFESDPQTELVVLTGEIGGSDEEVACKTIQTMTKPVVAFVAGKTAPPGKRMGHAGAIISGTSGTAAAKIEAFQAIGVPVADIPADIPGLVTQVLSA
ncbi:MAG: succinate--CoA ligase subunit alpha [Armatimonadetes bacterium CG_4_10_14_3_um_filter_66_18]|nr:succinate--CoA ligase subunit alpha [Armatimonadota bacterium]OIP10762.1 MAG: succinate--CoA ligase subunit alpha [Armatimonadetes bacterium CG2_30_66_41]PIU94832.1 MAG: succinate--CoA ligase subunit alpha [Armatimonadetes bacterium CG06_land_8_20_14_3_00_66_21]PIW14827.1 MAG: succinate--CoA ligase subunit alpha [Armatimonadetes bacterium CG17_big_fil_post_rev_8_21_14_2_50_66_6]PIX36778.1 MAG: succinate--CoA ligase subunit alpha [Armatimonadetes bacterium CG_4_8_14_3_um_filter_66_20]PIY3913